MIICILILKKALQCFWNPVLLFPGVECGNWKLFATKIAKNTKNVKKCQKYKKCKKCRPFPNWTTKFDQWNCLSFKEFNRIAKFIQNMFLSSAIFPQNYRWQNGKQCKRKMNRVQSSLVRRMRKNFLAGRLTSSAPLQPPPPLAPHRPPQ